MKITLKNIKSYLEGTVRYTIIYSPFKFLIRKHILEQYLFRLNYMDQQCYDEGSCKLCGCQTTALQCASKACDKPCYPSLMSKEQWNNFKAGTLLYPDTSGVWEFFPSSYVRQKMEDDEEYHLIPKAECLILWKREGKYKGWTKQMLLPNNN